MAVSFDTFRGFKNGFEWESNRLVDISCRISSSGSRLDEQIVSPEDEMNSAFADSSFLNQLKNARKVRGSHRGHTVVTIRSPNFITIFICLMQPSVGGDI
jgi:hypothetical protein